MPEPLRRDMFADCEVDHRIPLRVGDKWTAKILACLRDGPRRFSELRVPLHMVTAKVLTESLRALERDGMLTRTVHDENPPHVEYALTPLGRTLFEPMAASCAWTRVHGTALARARQEYVNRLV
jgi:DNA-binding HxlR family transcriptional regulator